MNNSVCKNCEKVHVCYFKLGFLCIPVGDAILGLVVPPIHVVVLPLPTGFSAVKMFQAGIGHDGPFSIGQG